MLAPASLMANDASSQTQQQWVIVLDDPRPARLQGWQQGQSNYSSNQNYKNALELKRRAKKIAKRYKLELEQQWYIDSLSVYCLIVNIDSDQVETTLSKLKQHKHVAWVQPSGEFNLLNSTQTKLPKKLSATPPIQTAEPVLGSLSAHADGTGVRIALVDSAVDSRHIDIAPAIEKSTDFVSSSSKVADTGEAHGTAIASVLIAQKDSKVGLSGIAPQANLLAYRGCWEDKSGNTNCNTLSLARALNAVVKNRPDILNLSLSGPKDLLLDKLIERIVLNETLVVAAFDPQRPNKSRFPSRQDGVLIVRAETLDNKFQREFTAPGSRIVASPGNSYNYMSGHSVAAAYASGVLALLRQKSRDETSITSNDFIDKKGNARFKTIEDLTDRLM